MEPATVLSNMRIAIRQYGSRFGGNPVGTNPEITKALNGDNPKEVRFLSEESGLRINARGELVDYWGTPFFFHQLSGTEMEIRSAGADRVMWTPDDLVTKLRCAAGRTVEVRDPIIRRLEWPVCRSKASTPTPVVLPSR